MQLGVTLPNSVVTDVQFGQLFLVCIKYDALQEVTCTGYSERYDTVVSTFRIILCFSYLLTHKTETRKGCDGRTQRND